MVGAVDDRVLVRAVRIRRTELAAAFGFQEVSVVADAEIVVDVSVGRAHALVLG